MLTYALALFTALIPLIALLAFTVWVPVLVQGDPRRAERQWSTFCLLLAAYLAAMLVMPHVLPRLESRALPLAVVRGSLVTLALYLGGCLRIHLRR